MADTNTNQIVDSRRTGFQDVYVAKILQNDNLGYKTDTPIKIGRAINAKITIKKDVNTLYSDDVIESASSFFQSGAIEININDLSPQMKSLLLGATYTNGFLEESVNDQSNPIAIGWRSKRTDGQYEFVWFYNVIFNQGLESDYQTISDKSKDQTPTLKGTIMQRQKDGKYKIEVNGSYLLENNTSAKEAINNWFSKVIDITDVQAPNQAPTTQAYVEPQHGTVTELVMA